jgi:acetolactate synthase-1/3 small subunit
VVEHFIGNEGVGSSILLGGTINFITIIAQTLFLANSGKFTRRNLQQINIMNKALSVYEIIEEKEEAVSHTLSVVLDNEPGALSRVIGVFTSRGYNIDSLTVSEVDPEKSVSRITIVTKGPIRVINQIMALLDRLIPVYEVRDLSFEAPHIERALCLVKVLCEGEKRAAAQTLADRFGAKTIDSTPESFIFELSDMPGKIDKFLNLMWPLGVVEVCRTGVTAIARGAEYIEY